MYSICIIFQPLYLNLQLLSRIELNECLGQLQVFFLLYAGFGQGRHAKSPS